jgi:hypothetical protein
MATIKLADVRKEHKESKGSVKGCIKMIYSSAGKQTNKLLNMYGKKSVVFGLAKRIEADTCIGQQAVAKDGSLRFTKTGKEVLIKVSVDLVLKWFVSNQDKAAEIVAEVAVENAADNQETETIQETEQVEDAAA